MALGNAAIVSVMEMWGICLHLVEREQGLEEGVYFILLHTQVVGAFLKIYIEVYILHICHISILL